MKRIIVIFLVTLGLALSAGCSEFLDTVPDNRTTIDTPKKISQLLATAYPDRTYMTLIEHRCDGYTDFGSTFQGMQPDAAFDNVVSAFLWDEFTRSESGNDTNEQYWTSAYNAIAVANHALEAIEQLPDPGAASLQKGEALLARAYAHFCLLTLFADFFDTNNLAANPGIPYVTEPETVVIKHYDRETAAQTLEHVLKDLEEGMQLVGGSSDYDQPKFHFTRDAAAALGARIALFSRNYNDVIRYANMLLPTPTQHFALSYTDDTPVLNADGSPAQGVDPNDAADQFMRSNLHDWRTYIKSGNPDQMGTDFTSASANANLLLTECVTLAYREMVGTAYVRHAMERTAMVTLLTENVTGDPWIFQNVAYQWNGGRTYWLPKFYEDFKIDNPVAQTGVPYSKCALLRLEEVLLARAEAYAMLGNYDGALDDLNMFAACRIDDYAYGPNTLYKDKLTDYYTAQLNAPDHFINSAYNAGRFKAGDEGNVQKALILTVLDFRRIEFLYEGIRYWDVLRWNIPVTHTTIDGATSTLTPDDDRRILQIPQIATASGIQLNDMVNIPYPW